MLISIPASKYQANIDYDMLYPVLPDTIWNVEDDRSWFRFCKILTMWHLHVHNIYQIYWAPIYVNIKVWKMSADVICRWLNYHSKRIVSGPDRMTADFRDSALWVIDWYWIVIFTSWLNYLSKLQLATLNEFNVTCKGIPINYPAALVDQHMTGWKHVYSVK